MQGRTVTRELKLALIVGFALVLVVTVLISDHLSHARQTELAGNIPPEPAKVAEPPTIAMGNDSSPFNDAAPTPTPVANNTPNTPAPIVTEPAFEPTVLTQGAGRGGNSAATTPTPIAGGPHDPLFEEIKRQGGTVHGDTIVLNQSPVAAKTVKEPLPDGIPQNVPPVHVLPPVVPAPTKTPAVADTTYTVAAGDSFFKISKQYYNDGKVWRKLAKYNKMDESAQLKVGTKLNIPSSEVLLGKKAVTATAVLPTAPAPTPVVATKPTHTPSTTGIMLTGSGGPVNLGSNTPAPATKGHTYTVKKGDTLAIIAQHELGNSKRAHEIAELNKKTIKDPDNVPLGAVLTLPA
jgi:nucleoid-associated protein YgaU